MTTTINVHPRRYFLTRHAKFTEEDLALLPDLLKWIDRAPKHPAAKKGISDYYNGEGFPQLVVSTKCRNRK